VKVNGGSSGMIFDVVGGNCITAELGDEDSEDRSSQVQVREEEL